MYIFYGRFSEAVTAFEYIPTSRSAYIQNTLDLVDDLLLFAMLQKPDREASGYAGYIAQLLFRQSQIDFLKMVDDHAGIHFR